MKKKILIIIVLTAAELFAQHNLNYYLEKSLENSPDLNEITNLQLNNNYQSELNQAQTSALQVYLTANYLFAPFFNNNGQIVSVNPSADAIGYDVGVTNGGFYSAMVNVEKNLFNGGLSTALSNQISIQDEQLKFKHSLVLKSLRKQVIEQYLTAYKSMLLYNLSEEVVDNLEKQLKITGDLVAKGYIENRSFIMLKIELQSQQIVQREGYHQYATDLQQLNSLCGITDTSLVFIESVNLIPNEVKSTFSFLEQYKLDSIAVNNQQEIFETKYLPEVKVYFNTGLNAVELSGIQRKVGLSAGIDFQLPLFDGGQKDITRQQNIISQNSIKSYRHFTETNIENQKQITNSNINNIKRSIADIDKQMNEYNQLINLSEKELKTGNITMIEYLAIINNYISLKQTKIENEIALQIEINNYNYWN